MPEEDGALTQSGTSLKSRFPTVTWDFNVLSIVIAAEPVRSRSISIGPRSS